MLVRLRWNYRISLSVDPVLHPPMALEELGGREDSCAYDGPRHRRCAGRIRQYWLIKKTGDWFEDDDDDEAGDDGGNDGQDPRVDLDRVQHTNLPAQINKLLWSSWSWLVMIESWRKMWWWWCQHVKGWNFPSSSAADARGWPLWSTRAAASASNFRSTFSSRARSELSRNQPTSYFSVFLTLQDWNQTKNIPKQTNKGPPWSAHHELRKCCKYHKRNLPIFSIVSKVTSLCN